MHPSPENSPYDMLGGEQKLRALVDDFYNFMDARQESEEVRKMHPEDLQSSRDKLFMFLSGWLGGPDLYAENIGHPMLRRRHMPFSIGAAERDQWMDCMCLAMDKQQIEGSLREYLENALRKTAQHMMNQEPPVL